MSLRNQLLIALVGVAVLATGIVGYLAYDSSRDAIRRDALHLAGGVADSRAQTFLYNITRQKDRAAHVLSLIWHECEIEKPGSVCIEREFRQLARAERASAGLLVLGGATYLWGDEAHQITPPQPDAQQLARISIRPDDAFYEVWASEDDAHIVLRFDVERLNPIFLNRGGLGEGGENFLADANGAVVTPVRGLRLAENPVISSTVMKSCLAGASGETFAEDQRGAPAIMGYRALPQVGGGCVMVQLDAAEAFGPAVTLGRRIFFIGLVIVLIASGVAFLIATKISRPIQQLRQHTELVGRQEFNIEVNAQGPSEVRQLGESFAAMANSLSEAREAHRREEEARAKLAGDLKSLLDSTGEGIFGIDREGNCTFINAAASAMLGYEPDEIIGHNIHALIHARRENGSPYPEADCPIQRSFTANAPVRLHEDAFWKADGSFFPSRYSAHPIEREGEVVGAVVVFTDISERRMAEEAMRRSEKLAVTGRMAATIAHEINNPLEAVTNLIYLASSQGSIEVARQYLAQAEGELARVAHITKQTLGFYREHSAPKTFDVGASVSTLIDLYHSQAVKRGISVERQIEEGVLVTAVEGEIRQVVSNLLSNAIEVSPRAGRIKVRVRQVRDEVLLAVADNGTGIDGEARSRIFDAFFTTKKDVGTGLGLWITKEIVERHGGSIRVFSSTQAGRSGTIFAVTLPKFAALERSSQAVAS